MTSVQILALYGMPFVVMVLGTSAYYVGTRSLDRTK